MDGRIQVVKRISKYAYEVELNGKNFRVNKECMKLDKRGVF